MTLLEDLEALVPGDSDAFRNLTGERAARIRAAAERLRDEFEHLEAMEDDEAEGDAVTNAYRAVVERINGGPK